MSLQKKTETTFPLGYTYQFKFFSLSRLAGNNYYTQIVLFVGGPLLCLRLVIVWDLARRNFTKHISRHSSLPALLRRDSPHLSSGRPELGQGDVRRDLLEDYLHGHPHTNILWAHIHDAADHPAAFFEIDQRYRVGDILLKG